MKDQKIAQNATIGQALGVHDFDLGKQSKGEKKNAPQSFSIVVRTLLQNWRQGTVACKNRSQVSGSNKKPWKQKGTGRARAGAVTSPVWRGGGIVFGPQKRTRMLKASKKLWHSVARNLLQDMLEREKLLVIDWALQGDKPSTKQAHEMLKNAGLVGVQTNVFVTPDNAKTVASFVNIPSVRVVYLDAPNAYDLSDARYWVMFKNDSDAFKKMVTRWT